MRHAARLARLERLGGMGVENCPLCRLLVRSTWSDPSKPAPPPIPELEVDSECELCGGRLRHNLSKYSERERDLARLFLTSKTEDFYTDPRAYAAWRWYWERDRAREARRKQRRERERMEQPDGAGAERRGEQENGPGEKLYSRLLAEFLALRSRQRSRLQAKYGARPFPELDARLDAVTRPDRKHLYEGPSWSMPFSLMFELEREEEAWLKCAEAERFVLGEALALTLERAADCDRRAVAMIEEARRKYEEETAEQERRRNEFLEEGRRLSEKKLAEAPASPAPVVTPPVAAVTTRPTAAPATRPPVRPQPACFIVEKPSAPRRGHRSRRR